MNCPSHRIMARSNGWVCAVAATLIAVGVARADDAAQPPPGRDPQSLKLLLAFQGKGSSLPYDAGVLHECYVRLPALRDQQVIVTGNSSGAILAAYFSCFGFTDASVRYAEHRLLRADVSAIRKMERPGLKTLQLARGQRTELDHLELKEFIAFALGVQNWRQARSIDEIVRQSRVRPVFPVIIATANQEVLDNRGTGGYLARQDYKEFDPDTNDVLWKPDVYEFYRSHPERFAREHPRLTLGPDRRIGKAMTFFVDRTMYDLLSQVPVEQRQADLRLMTNAADVATAILASVSEPTYFDPIVESEPGKLLTGTKAGDLGTSRQRRYCGGFILFLPAQDARRMLPGLHVLGTGWKPNPLTVRTLLQAWYLAELRPIAQRAGWWADMELPLSPEFQQAILARTMTSQDEYDYGRANAQATFDQGSALPAFVTTPKFADAATGAIWPGGAIDNEAIEAGGEGPPRLKTLRGLGPLLPPP